MKSQILHFVGLLALICAAIFLLLKFWIFTAIIICLGLTILLLIWEWLAPTNRWFTFVKEGTAKIVVKGDAFKKVLIQWTDHTVDDEQNVVDGEEPWHPFGGFRFYGFWPLLDVYTYNFKWSGVTEDGEVVKHPKELIDYILLKDDVYWVKVEKAEDKNLLPLDIELFLTISIVNPHRALFSVQNWLETVINQIKPTVRDIITNNDYENWIKNSDGIGGEIYEKAEEKGLLTEFETEYGVRIKKIQVKKIDPPEDYRKETMAGYLAEVEKKKTVIQAQAEQERIGLVFSKIQEFGDLGKLLKTLEAVEKSPLAASLTVQAVPGLPEILKGIFGKPAEAVTSEEFQELRETVKRLSEGGKAT